MNRKKKKKKVEEKNAPSFSWHQEKFGTFFFLQAFKTTKCTTLEKTKKEAWTREIFSKKFSQEKERKTYLLKEVLPSGFVC